MISQYFTRTNAVYVILESRTRRVKEFYLPSDRCRDGPALTFAPPAFFGDTAKIGRCRSMVAAPFATLKIVFSPRRVIV